tara:strand:- start:7189 stop:7788 length:600 start_codon:yes stop_codon:yes gene_type:complete
MQDTTIHSEKLLVKELMAGNEKAFTKLFNTYRDDVYGYSVSMLKNQVIAEGVVQDVFLNIWEHKDRLNPNLSFKSYVFTITRNLTFNLISKAANNRKLKEEVFYTSQKAYNPIENKIGEVDYEIIKNKAFEQLPPKRRIIFNMSRNKGMSHREISEELNISVSTVKGQTSKALATIREFLRTHGDVALLITLLSYVWLE